MSKYRLIFYDTETTGLPQYEDRSIQNIIPHNQMLKDKDKLMRKLCTILGAKYDDNAAFEATLTNESIYFLSIDINFFDQLTLQSLTLTQIL